MYAKKFHNVPLNSNTLEAYIGYEAAIADIRVASIVATKKAATKAAAVLNKASKVAPITAMSNGGAGGSGPNNPVSGVTNISHLPMDALDATPKFTCDELIELSTKFDGQRMHNGHPVNFSFKHAFEGEVYKSGNNFGGLHQDRMGALRKQGFSRMIKMDPTGFNEVEVLFRGRWIKTTNFPDNWTYDEIMKCVFEIYDKKQL